MKSLALSLPAAALALFALTPTTLAQRSVQIGAGYDSRSSQLEFGVSASFANGRGRVEFNSGRNRGRGRGRGRSQGYERSHAQRNVYVPGRYEIVQRKVWVPGALRQEWTPAQYETRYDFCGNPYQVLVRAAYYRTVQDPGCYEFHNERVWVAAHWEHR